ncbi:MAG: 50S ribosomal protein L21 [Bacteroidales bacterium]|nr:50S ribosomal protein L21 [Bacteroidales bacterium]HOY38426.1 50S ribosomal protein L21 [Bacteroidales bacterium]HQP03117.1 50S ribosomal protein L21 [Bacteroidales bacterium]
MYAIVEIAGQQFKVEKGSKLFVHRLSEAEGNNVDFDKVLLIENENKFTVGRPVVENAKIVAKVVSHVRGDKVLVFKKKNRKGYQVLNGHRQNFSEIEVQEIIG